ncbi:CIC11C00000001453 [Sungouiella intermedia]|uniref:CIC11C00000001453 n=1 Tax=Sungouiella intermedia TaxID=45354 RepID=A0A1L0DSE8_9ASCO|nr:CIC11C00000001453 [[Candida] intermedia]
MAAATKTQLNQQEIIPQPTDVGALANRINLETRSLHNKIDKLVTLKFAIALRDYKIYRQGLQSFYHVFATVEKCLNEELADPSSEWSDLLSKVWKPEMARLARCEKDLMFYYNNRKEKFMSPIMPAQIEFVNHIQQVCKEKPYILLAYLHVMYLALFAGGRVMRSSISRATGLFPQKDGLKHDDIVKLGTNFFQFAVEDENTFRLLYKRDYELATRNALTEKQKLDIIEESKYIFEQNAKCVIELEHHNLGRIKTKWTYFFVTRGYYVLIFLFLIVTLFALKRVATHILG